jgi:hypothetical protein
MDSLAPARSALSGLLLRRIPFAVSQTAQEPGRESAEGRPRRAGRRRPRPYGFSAKKDLLAQLLALNFEVAANIEKGSPVTAPGVPKNYPDAQKLVTEDCIRPVR